MERSDLLEFEHSVDLSRRFAPASFELRADPADPNLLVWDGYSCATNQPYDMYGGSWPGWVETIKSGAFKKTLSEGADVAFKLNHEGMTLARTKSGTMDLNEDKHGEHVVARLDQRMTPVADLKIAADRRDIDEMSFAFYIVREEWYDDEGEPSDGWLGTQRHILEVNQNRGDVAPVNYGANPHTSGGFRDIDLALAELRAGRQLNPSQAALVRQLAALTRDDGSGGPHSAFDPHAFQDDDGTGQCVVCNMTEAEGNHVAAVADTTPVSLRLNALRLDLLSRRIPA